MNAVLLAVLVMLILAMLRVHVVLSLFVGALVGGLAAGMGIEDTMVAFQEGLADGAKLALSYALLGAFAMAVAHSGLPQMLANWFINRLEADGASDSEAGASTPAGSKSDTDADSASESSDKAASAKNTAANTATAIRSKATTKKNVARATRATLLLGIIAMAIMSQNLIPVHIAFVPLVVPPLLVVMNRLGMDRRAVACAITFGLVTTYMFLPIGFGRVFLHEILYTNIEKAGLDVSDVPVIAAMGIPALGMLSGLLIAIFVTYRRPRTYDGQVKVDFAAPDKIDPRRVAIALVAVVVCFGAQTALTILDSAADPLLIGTLVGLLTFMTTRAVGWREADDVFTSGMRMMALIGLIMITANGFAQVLKETKQIAPLVKSAADVFSGNRPAAAFVMLLVGLVITMGIGSSFSTLPIIASIYVPLCVSLGFSPMATVALVGTAGALGDAGSPASDSTLGPTAGLNADGQHDHMRDSVIPTFIHFNIPLIIAGWVAAMVL